MKLFHRALSALSYETAVALLLLSIGLPHASCQSTKQPPNANSGNAAEKKSQAAATPVLQIYEDDAMLKKPNAIIGGTVQNIGGDRLENLSVELELKQRGGDGTERREVQIVPQDLAPGEQGRYSLSVPSSQWSSSKVIRLRSSSHPSDITFKTAPGARRPPERIPDPKPVTKTVVVERPKPKRTGEEFINTPESADRIP